MRLRGPSMPPDVERPEEDDKFSGDPFTTEERRILRKMIKEEEHVAWFWASVRVWAAWIAAIAAAIVFFQDNIKKTLLWFLR